MSDERQKRIILERRARFVAAALAAIAPVACESKPVVPTAVPPPTTAVASSAPVPDSDGDGVPDDVDKCPYTAAPPEPIGHEGCPRACLTIIPHQDIVIRARVLFAENVATPPPAAREILDEVARALRGEPAIGVEIVGRAAPGESEGVAYARANLVRSSLVARGVADARLRLDTDTPPPGEDRVHTRSVGFQVFVLP